MLVLWIKIIESVKRVIKGIKGIFNFQNLVFYELKTIVSVLTFKDIRKRSKH
ncbi:hypothetical protein HanIR_Chr12g0570111 [Helianthus annuus]|nr:hypothetical protein HanIR_Chr12g0570111 [Helianthus annuus]